MRSASMVALATLLLLVLVGCGEKTLDYSSLHLVSVTGKVTLDGLPLVNARVRFIGEDGAGSEGTTNAAGQYTLRYDSNRLGAKPGKKKVTITMSSEAAADDPDVASKSERVPAKYNSATELEVEVNREQTTHNFALTSS